jgi:hypothetical protein
MFDLKGIGAIVDQNEVNEEVGQQGIWTQHCLESCGSFPKLHHFNAKFDLEVGSD